MIEQINIILDYIEHYLIHYIIVMAETAMPNHGMIIPLISSGLSKLDAISAWDNLVIEGCEKYNIEYGEDWIYKLTLTLK